MRIVNISSLYPPNVVGGAEQGLKTMSDAMAEIGHDVHIITLDGPLDQRSNETNVRVHELPLQNIYWPFDQQRHHRNTVAKASWHLIDTHNSLMAQAVRSKLKQIRPDIVLTRNLQGFSTAVMPVVKECDIPLVHVLHDFSLLCPQTTMFKNGSACGLKDERCTGCKLLTKPRWRHTTAVDGVIGVSQAVLDRHLDHGLFGQAQKTVIHNALKPAVRMRQRIRERTPGRAVRFGFLGRIEQAKGIETLLDATMQLQTRGVAIEVAIAGQGDPAYVQHLRSAYADLSVDFLGFVEAAKFLDGIDVLVFPSLLTEALGNGVFEAFARGVPVIGSDRGGIPETIDHMHDGMIFQAGDVTSLSYAMHMLALLDSARVSFAEAALEKAAAYLPHRRAETYIEFLDRIAISKRHVLDRDMG